MSRPIIDAHLDLAWNALSFNRDLRLEIDHMRLMESEMTDERSRGNCTISIPELRKAGVSICIATLLARSGPEIHQPVDGYKRVDLDYGSPSIAYAIAQGQLAYYRLLEEEGHVRIIRTREQLDLFWDNQDKTEEIGIIISMEGADPVVSPGQLGRWWEDGLRALGPVHYGRSQYAYGTGVDGLFNRDGFSLLREMENAGIILDVTHLCDASMAQALDYFGGQVLASHHNCRALVPGDRQLTDEQIKLLVEHGGVIGAALDAWMLYPEWERGQTSRRVVSLEHVVDHIDHVCQLAGSSAHAAIGSDLDGGFGNEQTPHDLDTIADLQKLGPILKKRGYTNKDIDAIFYGNWLRLLRNALPSDGIDS